MNSIEIQRLNTAQIVTDDIVCGDTLLHGAPDEPYDRWVCICWPHPKGQMHQAVDGTTW